jgi:penicillin-binding protein 2
MAPEHLEVRSRRARSALILAFLGLVVLLVAFFRIQVVDHASGVTTDGARLRAFPVAAPRGVIVDRHGATLAEAIPGYAVAIAPTSADSARRVLERLAPILELPHDSVTRLLASQTRWHGQRVVVAPDVPQEAAAVLLESRVQLRDVDVEVWAKRHYPVVAASHLVGAVGPRGPTAPGSRERGSRERLVGVLGVERQYEAWLAGVDGVAFLSEGGGRPGRRPAGLAREAAPVPGSALRLTIDAGLQEAISGAIPAGAGAAVVALDPRTGEVIALFSSPTFDPNEVSGPSFHERWDRLERLEGQPRVSRAIGTRYLPGGTWSVVTAAVALRLGIADEGTLMPLACRGALSYGDRYLRCREPSGHGPLTLGDALARGCDVYFYQLGLQVGRDRLLSEFHALGAAERTGIDLPDEVAGALGQSSGDAEGGGAGVEAMLLGAGRGLVEVTPLGLARVFAALLLGEPTPAPRLRYGEAGAPSLARHTPLDARLRGWLRDALAAGPDGAVGSDWGWIATVVSSATGTDAEPEWFVGLAEAGKSGKVLTVVVVLEPWADRPPADAVARLVAERHFAASNDR